MFINLPTHVMRFLFILLVLFGGVHSRQAAATLPIQQWQASSGAQVYFVQSRDLPILDISVDFRAGSSTDTPDKSGRAGLVLHLMDLGAGGLSEDQISKALADVGAQLGARSGSRRNYAPHVKQCARAQAGAGHILSRHTAPRISRKNAGAGTGESHRRVERSRYEAGSYC